MDTRLLEIIGYSLGNFSFCHIEWYLKERCLCRLKNLGLNIRKEFDVQNYTGSCDIYFYANFNKYASLGLGSIVWVLFDNHINILSEFINTQSKWLLGVHCGYQWYRAKPPRIVLYIFGISWHIKYHALLTITRMMEQSLGKISIYSVCLCKRHHQE